MGCENCGGCGSCGGGCRREIVLTPPEAALLLRLGEVAFLPVARRNNSGTPVCLEEADYSSAEYGEALAWLELKGLVSLDSAPEQFRLCRLRGEFPPWQRGPHRCRTGGGGDSGIAGN